MLPSSEAGQTSSEAHGMQPEQIKSFANDTTSPVVRDLCNTGESPEDLASPVHYTRDPHRLVTYLIPFPGAMLKEKGTQRSEQQMIEFPLRFLLFTPPPPPLKKPPKGEREGPVNFVMRKWQEELRKAKTSQKKIYTLKGLKNKGVKIVDLGIMKTKSSNLDFLGRVPKGNKIKKKRGSIFRRSPKDGGPKDVGNGEDAQVDSNSTSSNETPHDLNDGSTQTELEDSMNQTEEVDGLEMPSENRTLIDEMMNRGQDMRTETVKVDEIVFVYPESVAKTDTELRDEFLSHILRTKSKATRDAIIATGLLPVTFAIDTVVGFFVPGFGGLLEIDAAFAFAAITGARAARNVTNRLASSSAMLGEHDVPDFEARMEREMEQDDQEATSRAEQPTPAGGNETSGRLSAFAAKWGLGAASKDAAARKEAKLAEKREQYAMKYDTKLSLTFAPSPRVDILGKYLAGACHKRDPKRFPEVEDMPDEEAVIAAIGWAPSQCGGETRNWEEESWELREVKDDWQAVTKKGAKEWDRFVKGFERSPKRAVNSVSYS